MAIVPDQPEFHLLSTSEYYVFSANYLLEFFIRATSDEMWSLLFLDFILSRDVKSPTIFFVFVWLYLCTPSGAQVVRHSPPSFTKHPLLSWAAQSKVSKVQRRGGTAGSDGLVYQQTNCCPPWCFFWRRLTVWVGAQSKVERFSDWRHISNPLPTLLICVGLYWQVSLCLYLEPHSSTYCLSQLRARMPL